MLDFDFLCGACPAASMRRHVQQTFVTAAVGGMSARAHEQPHGAHRRIAHCYHHAGRKTPSVAVIVQPGSGGGFQKLFFGQEEIAIPQASCPGGPTLWEGVHGWVAVRA